MALKELVLELWALIVLRTLKPCWLGGYGLCCTRIFIVFQVVELGFNWTGSWNLSVNIEQNIHGIYLLNYSENKKKSQNIWTEEKDIDTLN